MTVTRVLIVDDERLFGEALELLLDADERIEVVGQARDGRQAIELARQLDPDVVLMDLSMPGTDGFAAIEAIVADEATRRVIVLSGSADPDDLARATAAGADGYLTKERIAEDLVPARARARGGRLRVLGATLLRGCDRRSFQSSMYCLRRGSSG